MQDFFSTIEINDALFLRNLKIFPLKAKDIGIELSTIDKARITEQGRVDSIILENPLNNDMFYFSGQEVIGAYQDRVIAESNILRAHSFENVNVVCVEEKRWEGGSEFKTGEVAHPIIRSMLISGGKNLQKAVWNEVRRKLTSLRVSSKTLSLNQSFMDLRDDVNIFVEHAEELKRYNGMAVFFEDRFVGADLFFSRSLWGKVYKKILKGYALDALEEMFTKSALYERSLSVNEVIAFLKGFERIKKGTVIYKDKRFAFDYNNYNKVPLNASFFPYMNA